MNKLLLEYLQYLEVERGYSERTLTGYGFFLKRFLEWARPLSPQEITQDKVREFRARLLHVKNAAGKGLAKKTQNYHLIALRGFLRYLIKNGHKTMSPEEVELAKVPERQIDFLDENEVGRLLDAPGGSTLRDLRDKAIIEVLFSTGLRVSELCSLGRYDVDFTKSEFSVRGKGGKIRVVFLSDNAKASLQKYLEARPDIGTCMFTGIPRDESAQVKQESGPITPRTIERIVKKYAVKAGIARKVTPHTLRHMLGTELLRGGANLRAVQMILGHQNVSTTQIYTHYANEELKEVHKKFLRRRKPARTQI